MAEVFESKNNKLAVLIDADNASANAISFILEEIAKYGIASVKRIYGDWSDNTLKGWEKQLLPHAIIPIQQFAYTKGKNATDIAMVIDTMDLLYTDTFDGFCIISSDSDFTLLAARIRAAGKIVYGFGETKTPESFRTSCDKFIYIETLLPKKEKSSSLAISNDFQINDIEKLLIAAVKEQEDDDGWALLSSVGNHINAVKSDFDPRNYGYSKLSALIKSLPHLFEVKIAGKTSRIRLLEA